MRQCLVRIGAVLLCGLGMAAFAADLPVEGQDYQTLTPAQPTSNPSKIVVSEFFSYQCPHCFQFYPVVTSWAAKLPKDVQFDRVPVSLGRSNWAPIAQAFYALQALDKLEQMDRLIFNAINLQNVNLSDENSITQFVAKQGINAAEFTAAYNSFGVKSSTLRAEQQMRSHHVQGTPTMVVDGKYVVMNEGTRSFEDLLARTDRIIAKVRAERGQK